MLNRGGLTPGELDGILTWSLVRATRIAGQRLAERLAVYNLNPAQFGVLAYLTITSPMTQADLARAVLVRPQSIAALLDGLAERGLIHRSGSRARGRRNPVEITDRGRAALQEVWETALATNDMSDTSLTTQESRTLNLLLLKIVHPTQTNPA